MLIYIYNGLMLIKFVIPIVFYLIFPNINKEFWEKEVFTFFWQVCPSDLRSRLAMSILLRTLATSFLMGSVKTSSSCIIEYFKRLVSLKLAEK